MTVPTINVCLAVDFIVSSCCIIAILIFFSYYFRFLTNFFTGPTQNGVQKSISSMISFSSSIDGDGEPARPYEFLGHKVR